MHLPIYILALSIFAMTTSEFMVAGMLPAISSTLNVSIPMAGFLVSIFAASIVIGGPILTLFLFRFRQKSALIFLMFLFFFSQVIGAVSESYPTMVLSRILGGVAESAFFGVAISIAVSMVDSDKQGRAASIVLAGIMIASVVGLPMATQIDQSYGWRYSFWIVSAMTLICTVIVIFSIPKSPRPINVSIRAELEALKNKSLWAAYCTSGLIIGATFSAFTFFAPIFTEAAQLDVSMLPILFAGYGAATVIGNIIVGRFADKYSMKIMAIGLFILAITLILMALNINNTIIAIGCAIIIGFTGLPMNPAMVTRVMRASNNGALVNSLHMSIINLGIVIGSWLSGLLVQANYGWTSPLWFGATLALLGLVSLLPYVKTNTLVLEMEK
ncbi:MFS transporter [Aeromonas hydrophila]|uniref:MFS transporter n=1 Tax=Aeromonas hydrophila TaxID=644 RepID=A0ABD7G0S8_AERHY|nr:MFS transporter [Aeromonas hydrophila]MBC8673702.1 MFS transporter [Aeromonas hydrophila]MBC8689543.1 MFS transporter [Aeromonas hydrophila]RCF42149.1 MFS transporter [Aeromonas hydrophila]